MPISISFELLLWIYAILPVCVLACLVDKHLFNGSLLPYLPLAPERFFWLSLLFGTPHILASTIILLSNNEYLNRYKWRLALATLFIIAFFSVGYFALSYNAMFALVATATVIHVVKQQIGLGNAVARLSGPVFQCWGWSVICSGIVLYNLIFLHEAFSEEQARLLNCVMLAFCAAIAILGSVCYTRIKQPLGKAFLVANSAMAIVSVFLYFEDYYFFAILGPRVIHDVSAFVFYTVHDHNRHRDAPKNTLYKILNAFHVSAFLAVPALAVLATLLLQVYGNTAFDTVTTRLFNTRFPNAITLGLIGYLSLIHYYTEAFTWRGDSPYKKYIFFKRTA